MNFELLKNIKISIDDSSKTQFTEYIKLFKTYNLHTNLISKNDISLLFEKHIYDSLAFNLFVNKYGLPNKIMDIGTGGGFPSLPLALIYKNTKIVAIDSTQKKINFIKEVKEKMGLKNIEPLDSRIEELPNEYKNSFDVVTTRALGNLNLILEYAIPYLKIGGYFIAYKSIRSEKELLNSQNTLKILNTELIDTIEYKLPLKENFDRKLLIFKKTDKVSNIYPRTYNIIKKNPIW